MCRVSAFESAVFTGEYPLAHMISTTHVTG